jgi:hypothetical protein
MPIPFFVESVYNGLPNVQSLFSVLKALLWLVLIYFLKIYFGGAKNTSERLMHSKVVMVTVRSYNEGPKLLTDF